MGALLFLLITVGLPCIAQEYLTAADRSGNSKNLVQGVPNALFVALGLGIGVFLAAVYGGMSRRIARRHNTDMLTLFFGGALGAMGLMMLSICLIQFPFLLLFGLDFANRKGNEKYSILIFGSSYLLSFIFSLVGFWLGGTFVARFIQRRLKPV